MRTFIAIASMVVFSVFTHTAKAEGFLYSPLDKLNMTCNFCCYKNLKGKCHGGIDFDTTDAKTDIFAAASGVVVDLRDKRPTNIKGRKVDDYGNFIKIKHTNGYFTIYAHLLKGTLKVTKNESVTAGKKLAVGDNSGWSSGSHLHFEVRDPSDKKVNPYGDPPDNKTGCGSNHLWATCPPTLCNPAPEKCNGKDDDCDGEVDEDFKTGLSSDLGQPCSITSPEGCQSQGKMVCASEGLDTVCNAPILQSEPEKCDGVDNDCNGQIDEPWKQGLASDLGEPCTVGFGVCQNQGQMVCTPDGRGTVCPVDALPTSEEICDGLDNDCDGVTDNACVPPEGFSYCCENAKAQGSKCYSAEAICIQMKMPSGSNKMSKIRGQWDPDTCATTSGATSIGSYCYDSYECIYTWFYQTVCNWSYSDIAGLCLHDNVNGTEQSYCTKACRSDSDCPSPLICRQTTTLNGQASLCRK